MKGSYVKRICFFMCLTIFSCLLISGADRLIVQQDKEEYPLAMREIVTYLCCPLSERMGADERSSVHQSRAEDVEAGMPQTAHMKSLAMGHMQADANGNVLRSVSYMRSVYQSFDLGDGFV